MGSGTMVKTPESQSILIDASMVKMASMLPYSYLV